MLKLVGAVLIMASASGIGVSLGMDLKQHCRELRQLKQMIYLLRGELKYTRTPLPEAFEQTALRMPEPFGSFLREAAEEMRRMDGRTFGEVWREEIGHHLTSTRLKPEEREQLGALGEVLGYLDLDMQLSAMDLYLEQLELSIQNAQESMGARQRVYQSLGVAAGIFLVILLL
jgi:stage III sporulation protein AB